MARVQNVSFCEVAAIAYCYIMDLRIDPCDALELAVYNIDPRLKGTFRIAAMGELQDLGISFI